MEIMTGLINKKTLVKKGIWQDPQRKLGPMEPFGGHREEGKCGVPCGEPRPQRCWMGGLSTMEARDIHGREGPQKMSPSHTSSLAQIIPQR